MGASQASRDEAVTGRDFCVKEDVASSPARGQSSSFHLTSSSLFHSPHSVAAVLLLLLLPLLTAATGLVCSAQTCPSLVRPTNQPTDRPKRRDLPATPILAFAFAFPLTQLTTHYTAITTFNSTCFRPPPPLDPGPCRTLFPLSIVSSLSPLAPPLTLPLTPRPRSCSPSEATATTYASAHKRSRSPLALRALALPQCSHNQQPICKDPGCHRVRLDCHRYEFSSYSPYLSMAPPAHRSSRPPFRPRCRGHG